MDAGLQKDELPALDLWDGGLRMNGIPALDFWDSVIEVLHPSQNIQHAPRNRSEEVNHQALRNRVRSENQGTNTNTKKKKRNNREVDELYTVDQVVTSAKPFRFEAQLYTFEDNEAVIKMMIKGRSPTKRHVSRTRQVALDWLFDRINLDPQIQVKHVDTKNQLADMLTKGNFTRDERDQLLRLFNIMNFLMFSFSHFLSIKKPNTMSKRTMQEKNQDNGLWWRNRSQ